jgi:DNA-binding NarL/FixJ family response regulator
MQQAGTDTATVLRDHVRVALEDAGLMVVGEAADGAHALTQAAARDPDVVLMDLRMPGMDGIQAAQAPRGAAAARGAVDRGGDAPLASAIRKSGAHAGVAKGIRTVELVATSRSVCEVCPRPRRVHARGRTRLAAGYAVTEPTGRSTGTSRVRRPSRNAVALVLPNHWRIRGTAGRKVSEQLDR